MAHSLRPPAGHYPLTLGDSFVGQKQLHLIKYDFRPASVDPSGVGDFELRSDLSSTLLLPLRPAQSASSSSSSSSSADVPCVEFSGALPKKSDTSAAPTCLLLYDPVSGHMTLERVETSAVMKQVVRDADAASTRKRKMTTAATMQRRAHVAQKRQMTDVDAERHAAASTHAVTAAAAAAAAPALASKASKSRSVAMTASRPAASIPSSSTGPRPLVHISAGVAAAPEFAEDDGVPVQLSNEPIVLQQPSATTEPAASIPSAPSASSSMAASLAAGDFSFMTNSALQATASSTEAAPAAAACQPAAAAPAAAVSSTAALPSESAPDHCKVCDISVPVHQTGAGQVQCEGCYGMMHQACAEVAAAQCGNEWTCPECS